ncbi:MAG: hypothetical protein GY928_37495 [Colwellia sp.]|nr:hypothetical protein [Colwellia sp.]
MSDFLNSALGKCAISRENNDNLGIPSKDFTGTDSAFYFEQDLESPLSATENVEKTVKKSTRARQIQSQSDVMKGNSIVGLNFSNNVSKNDFATLFMPMFFQHGYLYTPTITNSTITAVSSAVDVVTITVTDAGAIANGDYVVISGRTVTAENGTYEISNLSSNSFDITFVGGFDSAVEGLADAEMNTHESVFEDLTDCNKKRLESSFTIYQPYFWDKADCAIGSGEIVTGLAPKSGALNFVDSTYTIDMVGSEIVTDSVNLPKEANDYKEPINETGTYFDNNRPVIKDSLGNAQNCLSLDLNVTLNTSEDLKAYKAGKFDRVITDGATLSGSLSMLFLSEDALDNHSALIYANRKDVNNNGVYSLGLSSNDGSSLEITSNMNFMNEAKNKVSGGWELSMDFEMLYDYTAIPISVKCVNGINQTITELFSSEA